MATTWLPYNGQPDFGLDNAAFLAKAGQMTAPSTTQIEEPSDRSDRKEPEGKALSERSEASGYGKTINGAQRDSSSMNPGNGLAWQVFVGAELVLLSSGASADQDVPQSEATPTSSDPSSSRLSREKPGVSQSRLNNGDGAHRPSDFAETHQPDPDQQSLPSSEPASGIAPAVNQGGTSQSFDGSDSFGADFSGQNMPSTKSLTRFMGGATPPASQTDERSSASGSGKSNNTVSRTLDSDQTSGTSPSAQALTSSRNKSNSASDPESGETSVPDTIDSSTNMDIDARLYPNIETVAYSGTGNANLVGNDRDNTIAGNTGNDSITGGAGSDQLIGGSGDDVFVFGADDGADQILDFSRGDKLQFDGLTDLAQISVEELDEGMRVYFAETQVDLIGVYGLEVSADWINSSR